MPSKEDLLFCKIAVMNGLVSETNAKKVLALVDKREKDNGRRPFIGAVFTKYNLMRTPDVEKVLEAVKKRGGGTTSAVPKSAVRRSAVTKSGRRARAQQTTRVESKVIKTEKRMDPATMWIGIGALVVCVGIIITIVFLVVSGGGHGKPGATKTAASAKDKEAEEAAERLRRLTAAPKATATAAAAAPVEPAKPALKTELPELLKQEIADAISDAMSIDPAQGLALLEEKKQKLLAENYVVPQNLEDALKNRREEAGEAPPPSKDAAPAPPAGDAPPAAAPADGQASP
jgi:hypothetical protein